MAVLVTMVILVGMAVGVELLVVAVELAVMVAVAEF